MKKLLMSTVLLVGLSTTAYAQKHPPRPPVPPRPAAAELHSTKAKELDKRYQTEKKLILNHPVATKKMKSEQLKALNARYQNEKKLLKAAR